MGQKRYAFLIGANGPQTGRLKYAERDAARLEAAFKASPCAFTNVKSMVATNREETLTELRNFVNQCEP